MLTQNELTELVYNFNTFTFLKQLSKGNIPREFESLFLDLFVTDMKRRGMKERLRITDWEQKYIYKYIDKKYINHKIQIERVFLFLIKSLPYFKKGSWESRILNENLTLFLDTFKVSYLFTYLYPYAKYLNNKTLIYLGGFNEEMFNYLEGSKYVDIIVVIKETEDISFISKEFYEWISRIIRYYPKSRIQFRITKDYNNSQYKEILAQAKRIFKLPYPIELKHTVDWYCQLCPEHTDTTIVRGILKGTLDLFNVVGEHTSLNNYLIYRGYLYIYQDYIFKK